MASINFEKMSKANIAGMKVHLDQECRLELNHTNKNINKELSHLNYTIGTDSYEETYQRVLERTKQVDELIPPKRVNKDRIICDSAYIVCPLELEENQQEFFEKAYEWFQQTYGEENVHGAFIHLDEKHEYRDSRVKDENDHQAIKESLYHAHIIVSCYTDEKGINGKAFNSRVMYQSAQKEFNRYVEQEFGIEYQTHEQALGMSVEALKEASNQLEQTERELEYKQQQNQELEQQLEQRRQQQELEQQQQEQQMQEQQRALDELNRLIEVQECERERNEHVRTQVQHWFDSAHIIQPVREVEPIQINDRVQTFEFHEKALNPLSPTHDYVLKEDFDKVLTQVKEYEKQLNNQVRDVNRAIEDVNQDNQHNYEVERANEALKARNEVLELDCHKYELEDVNSLNKSLEAEKGQLQQELNKAKVEIQELNQANKELEQENDNLVHQNNILKDTLERIVEFVDKALQPVIENPIIETLCSYLKREEKETVKEAESEYYKSKAVEERVVSYDRDDSYDLER